MSIKAYFTLALCALFICDAHAKFRHEISAEQLKMHVNFLSSDTLEGRLTGSKGEKLATQYIADTLLQLGLEPAGDNGTFFQEFNFNADATQRKHNSHSGATISKQHSSRGRNVLAKLKLSSHANQIIIISAHADHLGRGQLNGSRARNNEIGMIHAGADDNASGVASILEVAAQLSYLKSQGKLTGNKDIVIAAWSGEEFGILGSSHFVNHFKKTTSLYPSIAAVINLDMIGHLRDKLVVQGVGSSSDWPRLIQKMNHDQPMSLLTQNDPYLPTDTTAFYLNGVPTLNLFTGAHDDYHTPRDTAKTLNYQGIKIISEHLTKLILALEEETKFISYNEVEKPKETNERDYRIYLGTIPDYASETKSGVKLSGVAKNSPAELAGLKQDDVVLALAGKRTHDIYEYTYALNSLTVGKPVKMLAQRGTNKITLTIIARHR